jgi:hypothetical protein
MMQPQHDYAQVSHHHEHQHDDDSSTEVESLVGAEKQWATRDFQHTSQRSRRRAACLSWMGALRWAVVIGLQLVIVGLLAKEQGMLGSTLFKGRSTSQRDPGGDITGWSPHSKSSNSFQQRTHHLTLSQSRPKSPNSKSTKPLHPTTLPNFSSPKSCVPGTSFFLVSPPIHYLHQLTTNPLQSAWASNPSPTPKTTTTCPPLSSGRTPPSSPPP